MSCLHNKNIVTNCNFNYLEDSGRYMADIRITCEDCGTPFRFIGLPAGSDFNSPMVSVDGQELRAPIAPKGQVASELEGGTDVGFTIRKTV